MAKTPFFSQIPNSGQISPETLVSTGLAMHNLPYVASESRYEIQQYRRSGKSGIKLPSISLGLWHNFGGIDIYENARAMARCAFDLGICHFDLANNYGPPFGSAEETMGRLLKDDFGRYRDELFLSSKAGYQMWPGPYGEWGSRKSIIASCDQSLKRMGVDYVDLFYHHRSDPVTPLEESMSALSSLVKSGKALYVGISNYPVAKACEAYEMLRSMGTPCLIHQFRYSLLQVEPGEQLLEDLLIQCVGGIAFSPLAQGLLTGKYQKGNIPEGSRASKPTGYLKSSQITPQVLEKLEKLEKIAQELDISLAKLAIAWVLRRKELTSCLIGASQTSQIREAVAATQVVLSAEILKKIKKVVKNENE